MSTTFGDFDDDDALDTAPPDPVQVARKLHELEGGRWEGLTDAQQEARVVIIGLLLAWLRRSGALR